MTIAVNVASKGAATSADNTSVVTTSVTTTGGSGSVFLAFVAFYSSDGTNDLASFADSKTNSWVQVGSTSNGSSQFGLVYKCEGGTGGSGHTCTATFNNNANVIYGGVAFVELTGCATSSAVDQPQQAADASSPFASGATSTTTQAIEMLVGFGGGDSGSTPTTHAVDSSSSPTSGWTIQTNAEATSGTIYCFVTATQRVTSTGAYSFAFTQSGAAAGISHIVTVKEASGGGGIAVPVVGRHLQNMMRG